MGNREQDTPPLLPNAPITKGVEDVYTYVGAKIIFHCTFRLPESLIYPYVVWRIGQHRVERSTSTFRIINKRGECMLYIPDVESNMVGEVSCELRLAMPQRDSAFINKAYAYLHIVPVEIIRRFASFTRRIFPATRVGRYINRNAPNAPNFNGSENSNRSSSSGSIPDNVLEQPPLYVLGPPMFITYCRFADGFVYLYATLDEAVVTSHVAALNIDEYEVPENTVELVANIAFTWDVYPIFINSYDIAIMDYFGKFPEFGLHIRFPAVEVIGVPLEGIVKLRVLPLGPIGARFLYSGTAFPPNEESKPPPRDIPLDNMKVFHNKYANANDILGSGAFGKVVLVCKKGRKETFFAAKVLNINTSKTALAAKVEYINMASMSHPRVVELFGAFVNPKHMVLVMEYLWGGELFERILRQEHVKEIDLIPYMRQICEGLAYMHRIKIGHFDIKPENIMCVHPNTCEVKIIDFGLARHLEDGAQYRAVLGTRDFIAPEILNHDILTLKCDMWSLGVLTYILLSGTIPFNGANWQECIRNIRVANYNYLNEAFMEISDQARSFIDTLLLTNPSSRMTASEALVHPWIDVRNTNAMNVPMSRSRDNLRIYMAARSRGQPTRDGEQASTSGTQKEQRNTQEKGGG